MSFEKPEDLGPLIVAGKVKEVYEVEGNTNQVYIHSTDKATAGDGERKAVVTGKSLATWEMSSRLMDYLNKKGFKTGYIDSPLPGYIRSHKLDMAALEVIGRKVITGSAVRKFGLPDGIVMNTAIMEYNWKNDDEHDPVLPVELRPIIQATYGDNSFRERFPALPDSNELGQFIETGRVMGEKLYMLFREHGLLFCDWKTEPGYSTEVGKWMIGDWFTPDEFRLRKMEGIETVGYETPFSRTRITNLGALGKLDKQVFRDGGSVEETSRIYGEALKVFREVFEEYGNFGCELP